VAVNTNPKASGPQDGYGHGTHVVGTINGRDPHGRYIGVAPDARVVSVKISDDQGFATESDLLRGLQWVQDNRVKYNLRAVNLSVSTSVPMSYLTSPVSAAVEKLWRTGVVVVTASGNAGTARDATWAAPGNDPFVVTVGALDHNETAAQADDSLAFFSSRGKTQDGYYKPEVVAPGRKIVAPLAGPSVKLAVDLPDHVTDRTHIRLSGTSMAAPVTTGVVALLLQRYPHLQPDQVKWLLAETSRSYAGQTDDAGAVDAVALLERAGAGRIGRANQGYVPSNQGSLLSPVAGLLNGALGVTPDASYWNASYWNASYWNASYWNASYWNASYWNASYWNASYWNASYWN
jgi:serine protease AprX